MSQEDNDKYNRARDAEFNLDDGDGDDDDGVEVTEPEEELIAMISSQAKLKVCVAGIGWRDLCASVSSLTFIS